MKLGTLSYCERSLHVCRHAVKCVINLRTDVECPQDCQVCVATALSEFYHEQVDVSPHHSLEFQAGPNGKRTANT